MTQFAPGRCDTLLAPQSTAVSAESHFIIELVEMLPPVGPPQGND
jgi:hypothetical protein